MTEELPRCELLKSPVLDFKHPPLTGRARVDDANAYPHPGVGGSCEKAKRLRAHRRSGSCTGPAQRAGALIAEQDSE